MKFDMNRAWRDATSMVSANREVLLVLAGLFFFLPSLAAVLLVPSMQPPAAPADGADMAALFTEFYSENALWIIVIGLVQATGLLSVLALLRDEQKPTVADALKAGATGLLPYLAAQIVASFALMLAAGTLIAVTAATGIGVLLGLAIGAALFLAAYVFTKISLFPAAIAIEHIRNPLTALSRSWKLTRSHGLRLFSFYVLILVAFLVIAAVTGIAFGAMFALLATEHAATVGNAAVSGLIGAAGTVYFVAILAAVHRQLAGPSNAAIASTFN